LATVHKEPTQEESDAVIIQCLRIFAARGRQLRLQREREREQAAQRDSERDNAEMKTQNDQTPTLLAPKESECPS
jgi:hypothetical protein